LNIGDFLIVTKSRSCRLCLVECWKRAVLTRVEKFYAHGDSTGGAQTWLLRRYKIHFYASNNHSSLQPNNFSSDY